MFVDVCICKLGIVIKKAKTFCSFFLYQCKLREKDWKLHSLYEGINRRRPYNRNIWSEATMSTATHEEPCRLDRIDIYICGVYYDAEVSWHLWNLFNYLPWTNTPSKLPRLQCEWRELNGSYSALQNKSVSTSITATAQIRQRNITEVPSFITFFFN